MGGKGKQRRLMSVLVDISMSLRRIAAVVERDSNARQIADSRNEPEDS